MKVSLTPSKVKPASAHPWPAGRQASGAISWWSHSLYALVLAATVILLGASQALADGRPVKLLAFGDSLIHGYGLPTNDTFPAQLQTAFAKEGFDVEVINGGNSGDTSAAGRARLDWALADTPDVILITFGGNDLLRGIDPKETYRNMDAILRRLQREPAAVLLTGMLAPRNLGREYAAEFDSIFPTLARAYDVAFYPFFLDGVAARPEFNQPDGIHPNATGVAVIVAKILPTLRPLIEAAAMRSGDG